MLNIGKVVRGKEDYCLDRVARSQEEYYTGAGEAPGYWLGQAAGHLGVAGGVSEVGLHRMFNGAHPETGDRLGPPPRRVRVLAYDLTFRAPKSVSLLYGLGGRDVATAVRCAHEQAIGQALGYLERHAVLVTRGGARQHLEPAGGIIAAAFQHRTSRAGDPLLHTHVLVANLGQGRDGRWTALDGRALYWHAKTAGYLYQAALRFELGQRLGVGWGPVRRGTADLEGIRRGAIEAFSQRRQQVLRRLSEVGHHSARAAQAAALSTRPAKERGLTEGTLRDRWRQRAAELGLNHRQLARLPGASRPQLLSAARAEAVRVHLASAEGLTKHRSTFTRRDVIQAICDQLPDGAQASEIETVADQFLTDQRVVCPVAPDPRALIPTDLDHLPHDLAAAAELNAQRFSTHELLAIEAQVIATGQRRRGEGAGTMPQAAVTQALAAHTRTETVRGKLGRTPRHLHPEQLGMVRRLTSSGDGIELVNAKAGAGKTFALRVARMAWERGGYRVIGATLAGRAARQLSDEAGIQARTIARLLFDLEHPGTPGFAANTVVVIDEASMVGTRQLARILWHAERATAKVVLVGDTQQLPEIDAGGAFRGLWERLGGIELVHNRRQQQQWERQALDLLRAGDAVAAVSRYHQHGRVVFRQRAPALRRQLVTDWWAAMQQPGEQPPLMLAARRADVDELNRNARELMAADGRLGPDCLEIAGRRFAVGDRILALRNTPRLGVLNGTRGTILAIDHAACELVVRTDDGRDLLLPRWYVRGAHHRRRPYLEHGYASTGHKAQGLTTDRCFVLASDELYKEWGYVALSRGRLENRLYALVGDPPLADQLDILPDPAPDPIPAVSAALERSRSQRLALDQRRGQPPSTPAIPDTGQPPPGRSRPLATPAPSQNPEGDPRQELVQLRHEHRRQVMAVTEIGEALASGHPRRRRRRALARQLAAQQRRLEDIEQQLIRGRCQLQHDLGGKDYATSDGQHGFNHAAGDVQEQSSTDQFEQNPPRYLLAELGGRPRTPEGRILWRTAATMIESYRARYAITDSTDALGLPPDDPDHHADRQALDSALNDLVKRITTLENNPSMERANGVELD